MLINLDFILKSCSCIIQLSRSVIRSKSRCTSLQGSSKIFSYLSGTHSARVRWKVQQPIGRM
jgi:hypothetical protein